MADLKMSIHNLIMINCMMWTLHVLFFVTSNNMSLTLIVCFKHYKIVYKCWQELIKVSEGLIQN